MRTFPTDIPSCSFYYGNIVTKLCLHHPSPQKNVSSGAARFTVLLFHESSYMHSTYFKLEVVTFFIINSFNYYIKYTFHNTFPGIIISMCSAVAFF
jgi:hypothetical protein